MLRRLTVVVVAVTAACAALFAWGSSARDIGPLETRLSVVLASEGGVDVAVPPLGRLRLSTHAGPIQVRASVTGIDTMKARTLLRTRNPTRTVTEQVARDSEKALISAATRSVLLALLAAAAVTGVVFRSSRAVLGGTASVAGLLVVASTIAWATLRTQALDEPRFTGLLAQAPALVGRVEDLDAYGDRVAQLTSNVARVYSSLATLPAAPSARNTRLLWVSDIHNNPQSFTVMRQLAKQFDVSAVIDSGDIVDLGSAVENRQLAEIGSLGVPYLYARGNHDSGVTQAFVARQRGARVLEPGEVHDIAGVRVAGAGDPLYRPNKAAAGDRTANAEALAAAGLELRRAIEADPEGVDVAVVHEPAMAEELVGAVPLTLSGHTHERRSRVQEGTLRLVQGSSGGAGLRTFDTGNALPLQMSVLHFDSTGSLLAVDDVTVGGLGKSSVTVERHSAASYRAPDELDEDRPE